MAEKKKLAEDQKWMMIMTIIPVVILMNVGKELTDDSGMRFLYAGLFGGLGSLLGLGVNYLTKDKSRGLKVLATAVIIILSGWIIYWVSLKSTL